MILSILDKVLQFIHMFNIIWSQSSRMLNNARHTKLRKR